MSSIPFSYVIFLLASIFCKVRFGFFSKKVEFIGTPRIEERK